MKNDSECQQRAEQTAERIQQIISGLLNKNGVKKIFLCSILPCSTSNLLRDKTNSLTNIILRDKMEIVFPKDKVVWVEFENPIRKIEDWESKMRLHPTIEGYKIIAEIHAEKIVEELKITDPLREIVLSPDGGVKINNLWDKKGEKTFGPIIAGWYTLSFKINKIKGENPKIKVVSCDPASKDSFNKIFEISSSSEGQRTSVNFFTGYEGYGYTRSDLKLEPVDCEIAEVLFEKSRPSQQASIYGEGVYLDNKSKALPGELIEIVN